MADRLHTVRRPRADVVISPASRADLEWVGNNCRVEDRMEMQAAGGSVEQLIRAPKPVWVAKTGDTGERLCVFGCWPEVFSGWSHAWLIGTPRMAELKYTKVLMRKAPEFIAAWKAQHGKVGNVVLASNTLHVRWLQRLGARFARPVQINNMDFLPFYF